MLLSNRASIPIVTTVTLGAGEGGGVGLPGITTSVMLSHENSIIGN